MKSTTTRLILIALSIIAAGFFLWPTYRFYSLDSERNALDSIARVKWDSIHREDWEDARAKRIKLGLDLQGGIYITMEVDAPALLLETANRDAIDDPFRKAIEATESEAKLSDEPVIDIFARNFKQHVGPTGHTLLDYYTDLNLGEDISDEAILAKLGQNINEAVNQAEEVIRRRIDRYGVTEPSITKTGRRIIVELPGAKNEEEVRGLLQTTARLEFKLVKDGTDVIEVFKKIDQVLAGKVNPNDTAKKAAADTTIAKQDSGAAKIDSTAVAKKVDTAKKGDSAKKAPADTNTQLAQNDSSKKTGNDSAAKPADTAGDPNDPYKGLSDEEKGKRYVADHPFSTLFQTIYRQNSDAKGEDVTAIYGGQASSFPKGQYDFYTSKAGVEKIREYLARPDVRAVIPEDMVVAFSAHGESQTNKKDDPQAIFSMFVVTRDAELTGEVITDATKNFDNMTGRPVVHMEMSDDGSDRWADITGKNIKKRVAIVLDSAVYSAPTVQNRIAGGSSQITGSRDLQEAELLAIVLKAGALKAPIKIIEERIVGPSLGEDSINKGINSMLLAALLVVLFMAMYYAFGGVVADVAVIINVYLTMAVLAALQATLTLPGIGGLVVTIGMAVDGNILIYERIREELARGRGLHQAVNDGYNKAFAAIIDTHLTTIITGIILFVFGTGPIQGFAVTLIIGILATLFTAVFMTKTVFMIMLDRGATSINFGQPKSRKVTEAQQARA
ncbi:MAG: protein translocase subunit SecD [Chlorobi bacterium]|nr:MAG: preprotein translocase subunit SecD [Chlorobi bacterium OLB7]MBK8912852.1 protein translocase subunit SecD [Chlorobiota bacterium]MBX7218018.1 protein translocase subunit SecD [Candidatus Kapabacteria bacterium]